MPNLWQGNGTAKQIIKIRGLFRAGRELSLKNHFQNIRLFCRVACQYGCPGAASSLIEPLQPEGGGAVAVPVPYSQPAALPRGAIDHQFSGALPPQPWPQSKTTAEPARMVA